MKMFLLVSMISYSCAIEECRTSFRMCSYRDTRSTSVMSLILLFSRILIATGSPEYLWIAFFTFPNVPFPIVFLRPPTTTPSGSSSARNSSLSSL